jgi:ABC-type uncharacterized transport system ATPase subunit
MEKTLYLDTNHELKKLSYNFSSTRQLYNLLRKKLILQKAKEVNKDTLIKLQLIYENINKLNNDLEEIVVALDSQGYWELSDEDKERIKIDKESRDLINHFMPSVIKHKIIKKQVSNINDFCNII